ncbi:Mitogen-activated protein kinase kinase kinase [Arachis hypogaea]|nr:Mitogen-activated protein kinase kinase kinase [Arachis hypogaea]
MPSWWKSSKETKKKTGKESFIDSLQRKFKSPSEGKLGSRSGGSRKHCDDSISEKGVSFLLDQDLFHFQKLEDAKVLLKGLFLSHYHFLACIHQMLVGQNKRDLFYFDP